MEANSKSGWPEEFENQKIFENPKENYRRAVEKWRMAADAERTRRKELEGTKIVQEQKERDRKAAERKRMDADAEEAKQKELEAHKILEERETARIESERKRSVADVERARQQQLETKATWETDGKTTTSGQSELTFPLAELANSVSWRSLSSRFEIPATEREKFLDEDSFVQT